MSDVGYEISAHGYRCAVSATGAGLRELELTVAPGVAIPLTETWEAGTKPPLSAGLVLCPWPNRILDGRYSFGGQDYQLEITEPARNNASHGLVRRLDWTLVEHSASSVTQEIDVPDAPGWPFGLHLRITHELGPDGLVVTHTATNTGDTDCPFGLGMHTFLRAGNTPLDECTLQLSVTQRQPLDPERLVAVGDTVPVAGTDDDFSAPRLLAGVWLDTPFTGLRPGPDGRARQVLRSPDGVTATLWTDAALGWVQVFTADPARDQAYPDRGRALAVEPMTCPADAFNTGKGLIVLAPGQTWTGTWGIAGTSAEDEPASGAVAGR